MPLMKGHKMIWDNILSQILFKCSRWVSLNKPLFTDMFVLLFSDVLVAVAVAVATT